MAQAAITIAPRYTKPPGFGGTDVAWRVLCDLYPSAETPEVVLAVVEYCTARKLDPLRKPVHVVPMYNARLRRKVQVVMQGINELETTAHRTGLWAGMELPQWGPDETRTFRGEYENDDGSKRATEITLTFPVWCAVTVWRLVKGDRRSFAEQVFWIEAYGRAGFRSEVPNARWSQAPKQMLHKVAKAAALRAAFPEEVGDYAAEEVEGRMIEDDHHPGPTIDHVDEPAPSQPAETAPLALRLLEEANGDRWHKALTGLLRAATTLDEVHAIRTHRTVREALAPESSIPTLLRRTIEDDFRAAHERLAPTGDDPASIPGPDADAVEELIAEVETMGLPALDRLASNAGWRSRVRAAVQDFPPDEDRLNEAIAARRAMLGKANRGNDDGGASAPTADRR
jgi:phage recombination protein Bet